MYYETIIRKRSLHENGLPVPAEADKDVTLKLWEGMYHEIHNEPEQMEVFKVMIEWMGKHL